jgi:Tfp pilus assembly protein PilF
MKKWTWAILLALTLGLGAAGLAAADQFVVCPQDVKKRQALCALMIRYGKDALVRHSYLEARDMFQKAIQADPTSRVAWAYYNRALVLSLSWNFQKTGRLFKPGTAPKFTPAPAAGAKPSALPAKKPAPAASPIPPTPPDEGC